MEINYYIRKFGTFSLSSPMEPWLYSIPMVPNGSSFVGPVKIFVIWQQVSAYYEYEL